MTQPATIPLPPPASVTRCPSCVATVLRPRLSGEVVVRAKLLLVRAGLLLAVCKECGTEVDVTHGVGSALLQHNHETLAVDTLEAYSVSVE